MTQITPTSATCSQFSTGNAQTLSTLQYTARNGKIVKVSPSGFEYWVQVTGGAGSNTATISQSITTGNFSTLFGLGTSSSVYDVGCAGIAGATVTASPSNDTFTVQWSAASAGTYYIALNLATSAVKQQPVPNPATVHYAFSTPAVASSTSEIDLSP